ncbi:MAG TPA: 6-bladed beta-propeller [Bacteroidales bacterium]|nr:6-bladed beta-propeller [Bacteroidales bacterium]
MKAIIIVFAFFGILSCQYEKNTALHTIEIDADKTHELYLSSLFDKQGLIKLETADSSLIDGNYQLIKTRDYLLFYNWQKVILFNCSGDYLRQIGKIGHGPAEYQLINAVTIDTISETIYLSTYSAILRFDYNGKLIKSLPIQRNNVNVDIIYLNFQNESLWALYRETGIRLSDGKFLNYTRLFKYNSDLQIIDSTQIIKNVILSNNLVDKINHSADFSFLKTDTFFYYPIICHEKFLRDTLYKFEKSKLIPILRLDFSKRLALENKLLLNLEATNIEISKIYRTSKYVFANYFYNNNHYYLCHDLENKITYNMINGFIDDLYGTGRVVLRPVDLKNGIFYFFKEGYEIEGKIDNISESSNPVVFLIKFK